MLGLAIPSNVSFILVYLGVISLPAALCMASMLARNKGGGDGRTRGGIHTLGFADDERDVAAALRTHLSQ